MLWLPTILQTLSVRMAWSIRSAAQLAPGPVRTCSLGRNAGSPVLQAASAQQVLRLLVHVLTVGLGGVIIWEKVRGRDAPLYSRIVPPTPGFPLPIAVAALRNKMRTSMDAKGNPTRLGLLLNCATSMSKLLKYVDISVMHHQEL